MLRQQTQLPFLNNLVIFVTAQPALEYILEQKLICNHQAFLLMHSVSCIELHQYIYCSQNKNVHVMDHTDIYDFPAFANMELYLFRGYPTNEDKIFTTFCKEKKKRNQSSAFPGLSPNPSPNPNLFPQPFGQQATSVEPLPLQPNQQ